MTELCPHGRIDSGYCEPGAERLCPHNKKHCPDCAGLDVYAPVLYEEPTPEMIADIEYWGAVYWWRQSGRLWNKLVESERANKKLRSKGMKDLRKSTGDRDESK